VSWTVDFAARAVGDLADDGEAQAAARLAGGGKAEEALEDLLAGLGGDAGAGVLDLDQAVALPSVRQRMVTSPGAGV
jgi:hypothetical protein